jgi:hypothetical protein
LLCTFCYASKAQKIPKKIFRNPNPQNPYMILDPPPHT